MNDIVSLAALSQRFEADNRSLPTIVILQGGASKKHDVRQKKNDHEACQVLPSNALQIKT